MTTCCSQTPARLPARMHAPDTLAMSHLLLRHAPPCPAPPQPLLQARPSGTPGTSRRARAQRQPCRNTSSWWPPSRQSTHEVRMSCKAVQHLVAPTACRSALQFVRTHTVLTAVAAAQGSTLHCTPDIVYTEGHSTEAVWSCRHITGLPADVLSPDSGTPRKRTQHICPAWQAAQGWRCAQVYKYDAQSGGNGSQY
jgi:hypothetical protein